MLISSEKYSVNSEQIRAVTASIAIELFSVLGFRIKNPMTAKNTIHKIATGNMNRNIAADTMASRTVTATGIILFRIFIFLNSIGEV